MGPDAIPLSKPDVGRLEMELVQEVIQSGRLAIGPMTERFERLIASRAGCDHGVAVSSGTAGLHLLMHALEIGIGDEVITPSLDGAILPGITRRSVIELLESRGTTVTERRVSLDELVKAHTDGRLEEAFGTGTAAVVSPIKALGVDGKDLTIGNGGVGPMAQSLFDEITGIQRSSREDRFNWLVPVEG